LYDNGIQDIEMFHDPSQDIPVDDNIYHCGEYQHCIIATHSTIPEEGFFDAMDFNDFEDQVDDLMDTVQPERFCSIYKIDLSDVATITPNFEPLRPHFIGPQLKPSRKPLM
jgi:hypothetical protein